MSVEEIQSVKQHPLNGGTRCRLSASSIKDFGFLIVAVLSLSINFIPVIRDALIPKKSILTSSFQAAPGSVLSALVSNSGGKPGSIKGATIDLPDFLSKGHYRFSLTIITGDASGAELIPAGGSALVRFARPTSEADPSYFGQIGSVLVPLDRPGDNVLLASIEDATKDASHEVCPITFSYTNFDGSSDSSVQDVKCRLLRNFLMQWKQEKPVK